MLESSENIEAENFWICFAGLARSRFYQALKSTKYECVCLGCCFSFGRPSHFTMSSLIECKGGNSMYDLFIILGSVTVIDNSHRHPDVG